MISFNVTDPDGDMIKTKIELFPQKSKDGFIFSDDVDGNFLSLTQEHCLMEFIGFVLQQAT